MRGSVRIFRTQPGFTATVILVLALSVGANSALFTVVNSLLLRPLPFPESDRLVEVSSPGHQARLGEVQRARSLALAGEFTAWNYAVTGADGIRMAYTLRVTADAIPLLRIRPFLGRTLTHSDFGTNVLMLGFDYWKSLGAPRDIAGRSLILDGEPYAIAGVLAPDFFLSVRDAKLIVPNLRTPGRTIARLQPGSTPQQAQAEIAASIPGARIEVTRLDRAFYSNDYRPIMLLLATSGFVLLITCANVANLQLVRGFARRREFAIRAALGASRSRLVFQIAGETLPLAFAGAALGLWLTRLFHDVIFGVLPANISRHLSGADALSLDARVIGFTALLAVSTVFLFGLLPAITTLRFDVMARLRDAGRGSGPDRQRFGQALVAIEIALALMLLGGAGLTLKNLLRVNRQYLGFRPEGVLRAMTDFPVRHYSTAGQKTALLQDLERRLGSLPGVGAVGMVAPQAFPFGGPGVTGARFEIFGQPGAEGRAEVYSANPAYLDALRLPLLRGRWFTAADDINAPPVAVLGEMVARRYWPGDDCLGRRVRLNARPGTEWVTIVGIVGDVKNPIADHWQPTAYRPLAQTPSTGPTLLVRAAGGDPQALAPAVSRELRAIDPAAPEFRLVTRLNDAVYDYAGPQRFTTTLLIVFAALGLALAAAGVYGVMRYWVVSRTGEIGIRVALGAERGHVLRLVLGRASAAAAFGVAVGLAGSIALRKGIATQLIGISAVDPSILAGVSAVLFAVALAAAWIPARRAARIDPAEALRAE